jgi:hypothetical protein
VTSREKRKNVTEAEKNKEERNKKGKRNAEMR